MAFGGHIVRFKYLCSMTLDGVLEVDFLFHPTRHSLRHLNHKKLFNFALCTMSVEYTNLIPILVLAVVTGQIGLI